MKTEKKYRIISIEAERLVHAQLTGGFSLSTDKSVNTRLFSGILDYSLESERLRETCEKSKKMSRKTYFSKNGYDYTTAVINVKFQYTRHNFVSINGIYVREGYKVSENFFNSAEFHTDENGEEQLIAIKVYQPLEYPPLPENVLGEYFTYDGDHNYYVKRKDESGKQISFASLESKQSLREKLYRDGFDINGVHYVRYKRSAGSSRTGQCLFIAQPLYKKMMEWSLCGLDLKNRENMDIASFEAYISLSLSSISDTLRIPKESILFLRDRKSSFLTHAVSVEADENGQLTSEEKEIEVSNTIWDGEALLDKSVFEQSGYMNRGMMLLRNRFFKTCAFNTNLQKYFADNGITEVSQLCGYTHARNISDIKMVVTESSLKFLKLSSKRCLESKIDLWLKNVDDTFGIVKTDKPTGFFEGRVVRTSYQLLNTLGLTEDETAELLKDTFEYYEKVRSSAMYMRNYINYTLSEGDCEENEDVEYFNARQKAILGCLERNDRFADTVAYKDFRSTVLSSFSKKIRSGKLLVKGTNATIFGNGLELLAATIGKYNGDALALAGEGKIYCKHFENGTRLLGCRSPHVTMGNLMIAENTPSPEIDMYFNLTPEIVYVNAIGCNIQQRLNGCDYDSDAMLLTDNSLMVSAASRNAHFSVPVCSINSTKKSYPDTSDGKALLDHEISQNKIGDIINLSQLFNTLYWHNRENLSNESSKELYNDICILAVLSGMEIDKAKRNYNVATVSILSRLKVKYKIEKLPEFFKFIMYTLERKRFSGEMFHYDTTMDYVFSQTKMFTREVAKPREKRPPLASFVQIAEQNGMVIKSCKNDVRDCEYIKEYLRRCRSQIDELRIGLKGLDADEKYQRQQEIEDIYREAIGYVTKKLRGPYMLKYLLQNVDEGLSDSESDEKKFYWILFEALCLEQNRFFYKVLSDTRDEDIYYLIPDENGDDEIYGIRHSKRSKLERI